MILEEVVQKSEFSLKKPVVWMGLYLMGCCKVDSQRGREREGEREGRGMCDPAGQRAKRVSLIMCVYLQKNVQVAGNSVDCESAKSEVPTTPLQLDSHLPASANGRACSSVSMPPTWTPVPV